MIESLLIQNFQGHKRLVVHFDPKVTAIVGPSDTGKSAILRALKWVATNRPGGDAFIRRGADCTTVTMVVDGHEAERVRGKGKNLYRLDEQPYEAFGVDVPADIATLLNVVDINFQGQYDAPFWFSESPPEVSRKLNQIINLGVIDTTLGYLGGRIRETQSQLTVSQERLATAELTRDQLKAVLQVDEDLSTVEALGEAAKQTAMAAQNLGASIANATEQGDKVANAACALGEAENGVLAGEAWLNLSQQAATLQNLVNSGLSSQALATQTIPDLGPLEQLAKAAQEATAQYRSLTELIEEITIHANTEVRATNRAHALQRTLTQAIGKVCPLCDQPIK